MVTILKSITYLERIGKYSYNIAVATKYLGDKPMFDPVHLIQSVGEVAVRMVKLVTKASEEKFVDDLGKISKMDNCLDRAMCEDLMRIVEFISENEESTDVCIYYISIIKFLERVRDHACKIAEKINFMVTGMRAHIEWALGNDLRDLSRKFFTVSSHLTVYIATVLISGVPIVTEDLIGEFTLTVSHDPDNLLIEYAWFTWDGTEYRFIVRGVDAYTLTETQMGPSIVVLAYPITPTMSD